MNSLVVIYTRDGYWVGADSLRTVPNRPSEVVCKVHPTKFGLLLHAGNTQATHTDGTTSSVDREIEDELVNSESVTSLKENIRDRFVRDIKEELIYLTNDPELNVSSLSRTNVRSPIPARLVGQMTELIVLLGADDQQLGRVLQLNPVTVSVSPFGGAPYRYVVDEIDWQPLSALRSLYSQSKLSIPNSVYIIAKPLSYGRSPEWIEKHPRRALIEILESGVQKFPTEVGPPFVILHARSKGKVHSIKWFSQGTCPMWSDENGSPSWMSKGRNSSAPRE